MAQMVPGDQINVALRKQVLLGMFPASLTAAHSHFYYLLFFMTAAGVSLQLCGNRFKAGCCWSKEREGSGGLINKLEMSGVLGKGVRNHLDLVSLVRLGFPCLTMTKSLLSAPLARYFKDHPGIMPTPHPFQNR